MDNCYGALHYSYPQANYSGMTDIIPDRFATYSAVQANEYGEPRLQRQAVGLVLGQHSPPLQLHAPIPLAGQSPPLLEYPGTSVTDSEQLHFHQHPNSPPQYLEEAQLNPATLPQSEPKESYVIHPEHCSAGLSQPTFMTPSELLAELAAKGLPAPTSGDEFGSDPVPSESASKARRRAMAKRVGFLPTDPDTISSHDKKRYYLESLEQYALYLHQQFELLGEQPSPLERVATYPGLSCRSIRTALVHMENTTKRLNHRTLVEEEKFVILREQVLQRERGWSNQS